MPPPLPKGEDAMKLLPGLLLDHAPLRAGITAPLFFLLSLLQGTAKSIHKKFADSGTEHALQLPEGNS